MPGPFTVVTFRDADGDEFPISLIGHYATMQDAIADAANKLTKFILDGEMRPKKPITLDMNRLPYEWGNTMDDEEREQVARNASL